MDIVIVGMGGIGSHFSPHCIKMVHFLRPSEEINFHLYDGDTVEDGNIIRQDFVIEDIGKYKVETSANYLRSIADNLHAEKINIIEYPKYFKAEDMSSLEEHSIIVVGVDNYITRKVIEDGITDFKDVFVIFGGNEYSDGDVNVLWKKDGELKTPLLTDKHPEINNKDKFPDEMSCEEASVSAPQLILANLSVGLYCLEVLFNYLTKEEIPYHEKFFDLNVGKTRIIQ